MQFIGLCKRSCDYVKDHVIIYIPKSKNSNTLFLHNKTGLVCYKIGMSLMIHIFNTTNYRIYHLFLCHSVVLFHKNIRNRAKLFIYCEIGVNIF